MQCFIGFYIIIVNELCDFFLLSLTFVMYFNGRNKDILLLLLLLLLLLSLLSQSLLVFFLCISRAQTMHLKRQSLKSIILFIH